MHNWWDWTEIFVLSCLTWLTTTFWTWLIDNLFFSDKNLKKSFCFAENCCSSILPICGHCWLTPSTTSCLSHATPTTCPCWPSCSSTPPITPPGWVTFLLSCPKLSPSCCLTKQPMLHRVSPPSDLPNNLQVTFLCFQFPPTNAGKCLAKTIVSLRCFAWPKVHFDLISL